MYINKIGIELEGRWHKAPRGAKGDPSVKVRCEPSCNENGRYDGYTGEVVSEPITLATMPAWIRKNWPDHVNFTCGLHVHMSFTNNNFIISRLGDRRFFEYWCQMWLKWGLKHQIRDKEFWKRLRCTKNKRERNIPDYGVYNPCQFILEPTLRHQHINIL